MENVSDDDNDPFKKLQQIMDEDDNSEAENNSEEEEEQNAEEEDEDSDLPSDFEREMAVDSDNDDQDEEEEEEETAEKVKKDAEQHKKELEDLKERDPEFYEYLQKEGGDLLGFGESEDEDEELGEGGDSEDDGQEYSDMEEPEEKIIDEIPVLKKATLNEWIESVKITNDFKTFKKLLTAFKTAARMSEEDDKITFSIKIEDPTGKEKESVH
jgi:nucleolar complex protein 2